MAFLFFLFLLAPLTVILLLLWWITGNKYFAKNVGYLWLFILVILILGEITRFLTQKKVLEKRDYYGAYIIDRSYFPGKQADWQYHKFRFEITKSDSIYFYETDGEKVLKTYKGFITTTKPFESERLLINMEQPTHHILKSNPTTYRSVWDFILVFNSPYFHNVYFKKGKWKTMKN